MSDPGAPTGSVSAIVRRRRLQRLATLGVLAGLPAVVLAVTLLSRPPAPVGPPEGPAATDEDIERALAAVDPGYVGIEVCAECHTARATVVKTTRHYLACRAAPEGVTAPGFTPERGHFAPRSSGPRFDMSRAGGDFLVTRTEPDGRGHRVEHRVGLVYGSASKHDEMYFAWQDDRLFQLPVAWLHPTQQWGQDVNSNDARAIEATCLECHNTWVAHVPGSANRYRRDGMLLGVTCERCHGPGKAHTEYHRAHPGEQSAHGILHPGTLARDRLMDVCAQCHANFTPLGRPFSYRPGEPLGAHYHVTKIVHPEDDTTNQVRYLSESKCYQSPKSTMTCITCHDPHRPRSAADGCAVCHKPEECPDQPRIPEAVRGDCVGCHMPTTDRMHAHVYITKAERYEPFAPRAEHRIGVYPEARAAVLLAWARTRTDAHARAEVERLTEQLARHWANEGDRRRAAGRLSGAIGAYREALKLSPDPDVRKRFEEVVARQSDFDDTVMSAMAARPPEVAVPLFERALKLKPDYAFAHGALGNIFAATGRRADAVTHLELVAKCDPNDAAGFAGLAELALRDGRADEAVALCVKAHATNPGLIMHHNVWGLALLKKEQWSEAENQFRKVLRSDPAHVGGNRGLSESLRRLGNAADAVRFARRAAHYADEFDAEVLLTLADAYSAANRTADAREALGRALRAAERTRPDLAPTVRDRLHSAQ